MADHSREMALEGRPESSKERLFSGGQKGPNLSGATKLFDSETVCSLPESTSTCVFSQSSSGLSSMPELGTAPASGFGTSTSCFEGASSSSRAMDDHSQEMDLEGTPESSKKHLVAGGQKDPILSSASKPFDSQTVCSVPGSTSAGVSNQSSSALSSMPAFGAAASPGIGSSTRSSESASSSFGVLKKPPSPSGRAIPRYLRMSATKSPRTCHLLQFKERGKNGGVRGGVSDQTDRRRITVNFIRQSPAGNLVGSLRRTKPNFRASAEMTIRLSTLQSWQDIVNQAMNFLLELHPNVVLSGFVWAPTLIEDPLFDVDGIWG